MNEDIRPIVRGAYQLQKLRIATGLRVVANYKARIGQTPSTSEKELDKEGQGILAAIRKDYKILTNGMLKMPAKLKGGTDLISSYAELALVHQYEKLLASEKEQIGGPSCLLAKCLKDIPIWKDFLKGVSGIGPAMAGVIISEIDITKAKYASSVWKYAGLDVANGKGRSNKKDHLVDVEYEGKDGKMKTRLSITYNPFLKTKLMGVLSGSFLRSKSPYATVYKDYKHRLENMPAHQEKTKLHRHNMALRYMVKRFLVDLYKKWRELEGLPVHAEYSEAKLGLKHGPE